MNDDDALTRSDHPAGSELEGHASHIPVVPASSRTTEATNRQHEVDRLRLLLQKATGKQKALMVELEPSTQGFRMIVTGITAEHEARAAQEIADYMNILLRGALRFTLAALEPSNSNGWKADADGVLAGTITALATSPDALADVPIVEGKP